MDVLVRMIIVVIDTASPIAIQNVVSFFFYYLAVVRLPPPI